MQFRVGLVCDPAIRTRSVRATGLSDLSEVAMTVKEKTGNPASEGGTRWEVLWRRASPSYGGHGIGD